MQGIEGNSYTTGTPQDGRPQELVRNPMPYMGEVAPTPLMNENKMRPLAIRQLDYGYMVEVGCQSFAIESSSQLIAKLSEYILNPPATEAKHREGKLF